MPTPGKRPRAESHVAPNPALGDELRGASFEAVMSELQAVVGRLEEGELTLEESLAAFEKGVQLSREGSRRLEEAERRVEALLGAGTAPAAPEPSVP